MKLNLANLINQDKRPELIVFRWTVARLLEAVSFQKFALLERVKYMLIKQILNLFGIIMLIIKFPKQTLQLVVVADCNPVTESTDFDYSNKTSMGQFALVLINFRIQVDIVCHIVCHILGSS